MQQVADDAGLGRHRAFANAGGVSLGHADHAVNAVGCDAGAGAHAAGGGVGRGDVRVGAVIDVEECALCALEKDAFFCRRGVVQHLHGVGHVRLEAASGLEDALHRALDRERFCAERLEKGVVTLDALLQLFGKTFRVEDAAHAQADAVDLVAVSRADAAQGGAEFALALERLACGVECLVVREHHVCGVADVQPTGGIDAGFFQAVDLLQQADGVDDDAVADDAGGAFAEDAGGDEVQDVFGPADDDGVAGVGAALGAHDDVGLRGQEVDDLALALVAPLGAH